MPIKRPSYRPEKMATNDHLTGQLEWLYEGASKKAYGGLHGYIGAS
jgi:hypothetical protein